NEPLVHGLAPRYFGRERTPSVYLPLPGPLITLCQPPSLAGPKNFMNPVLKGGGTFDEDSPTSIYYLLRVEGDSQTTGCWRRRLKKT
ncbi:hypothetical protein ACJ72_08125, partial [Emergomyces africanus]